MNALIPLSITHGSGVIIVSIYFLLKVIVPQEILSGINQLRDWNSEMLGFFIVETWTLSKCSTVEPTSKIEQSPQKVLSHLVHHVGSELLSVIRLPISASSQKIYGCAFLILESDVIVQLICEL